MSIYCADFTGRRSAEVMFENNSGLFIYYDKFSSNAKYPSHTKTVQSQEEVNVQDNSEIKFKIINYH